MVEWRGGCVALGVIVLVGMGSEFKRAKSAYIGSCRGSVRKNKVKISLENCLL